MKRMISLIAAVLLLTAVFPANAMAYTVPETISVGLESVCKNAASATIGAGEILIGMNADGEFEEGGSVSSSSTFMVKPISGDFVAVEKEMGCTDALELTEELSDTGLDAYAAYLEDRDWTVYVKNESKANVEEETGESAYKVSGFQGIQISCREGSLVLPKDAVLMGTETADTIRFNGKSYRGMLTFVTSGTTMTAVNIIGLEEYLYGVVPSEMPQSYEKEALKAQAVAARTYAMTKLGAHTGSGYQLCDTTACQAYLGYGNEAVRTTDAIDATRGEIACYQGKPIEAVFSASSGGYTENSENVWSAVVPYLRAVPEFEEYGDNTWKRTLTLDELDDLLSAKGETIGRAEDIMITKLSTGGRVQELQIIGSKGTKILTKENIRTYFSAACGSLPGKMFTINGKGGEIGVYGESIPVKQNITSSEKSGSLTAAVSKNGIIAKTEGKLSSLDGKVFSVDVGQKTTNQPSVSVNQDEYEVYAVSISTVKNDTFVFEGVGMGHGVGLSQKGAQSMALMGYSYEDILCHYYTGITIED